MISVLMPTTGRPQMAAECARGLFETTEGHDVQLVIALDEPAGGSTREAVAKAVGTKRNILWTQRSERGGCSAAWNRALSVAGGDPVVFAADDLVWQEGWLDAALAKLAEFEGGWGFVGFNDGHWGAELSTHYLMSRRFIIEVLGGVIAWEGYKHSFNDLETTLRAKAAGRYAWCEDARVYHSHWLFGDREQDDTDLHRLPSHSEDERYYKERKAAGFPNEGIEPVIS